MRIIIGADIVPTSSNFDLFAAGDVNALIGERLAEMLGGADYRIFNLEVPLTDRENPIAKNGPKLIAPTKTVKGIKNIGADLVTVANNHIMDQGSEGLSSTLKILGENRIGYVGAGDNAEQASKPYIFDINDKKIGVYACVEHEFSVATESRCGANPIDPLFSYDHVSDMKKDCDYVIVLYHGGKEHYRYPSPELQRYCRRFIDKGADLVVCQHSHCIGCEEKYGGGTIVYGQGNFLFDDSDSKFWQTGLLIEIDERYEVNYIPLEKCGSRVRLAEKELAEEILAKFAKRSKEIETDGAVESKYREFAESMYSNYVNLLFADNTVFRALNKLLGHRLTKNIPERKRLRLINYIECESNRELLLKGLKTHKAKEGGTEND
ncbi:MAG: CapA family protein [Clostridia bacterium]|nr:CapA family protein [Clostridia bacterium]